MLPHLLTFAKVVAVFSAVVWAMKRRVPMGAALSAGGIAVALLMGHPPRWILEQLATADAATFRSPATWRLVGIMGLIVALSYVLQESKQIERLTRGFQACFRNPRLTLATLPALIGFLPMPGGALFSAPMVEAGAAGTPLDREDKALVNYWFRHVWEYAWPLYPGVIFTAQFIHRDTRVVALAHGALCAVSIAAGFLFLRRADRADAGAPPPAGAGRGDLVVVLFPFALIFGLHLVAGLALVPAVSIGLGYTALWTLLGGHLRFKGLLKAVFANRGVYDMMAMGVGASVFGDLMTRSGAISGITNLFLALHLPLPVLAVLLPAAVGFFSGMTIVYVMTTFPVLLMYPGASDNPIPVLALGFASGYCGTLSSPVHSCLVVSARYFQAELWTVIRRMLPACAIVLATGFALYALWSRVRI